MQPFLHCKSNKYYLFYVCVYVCVCARSCVCRASYPACNSPAPFCHLWPVMACPFLQYFSTLFHNRHDFRKTIIGHKMCVLFCSPALSETFLILRRAEPDVIKNDHVRYPLFLSNSHETGILLTDFLNICKYQI